MNQNQSFIGAYTRRRGRPNDDQRPGNPAAGESSSQPSTPPAEAARSVPSHHLSGDSLSGDSLSGDSSVGSETGGWFEDGTGQLLRVDVPAVKAAEPNDPPVVELPEPTPVPANANVKQAGEYDDGVLAADFFAPAVVVLPMEMSPELVGVFDGITEFPVIQEAYPEPQVDADSIETADRPVAAIPAAPVDAPESTPVPEVKPQKPVAAKLPVPRWQGAAWEVDAFEIPTSVADLFFDEDFFREIAKRMGDSVRSGLRTILTTSLTPGEGRSTVAIGTAIAAAATGLKVALVDVDLESPDQADLLRLDIASDWVEAIRGGKSLESVAIASLEDGVTLIPLAGQDDAALPVTAMEMDRLLGRLEGCFDLVIYDGPVAQFWATARIAAAIDSCLIVRDARKTGTKQIAWAAQQLQNCGVTGIGVVDNFCG